MVALAKCAHHVAMFNLS
jgi:hypothetical protein